MMVKTWGAAMFAVEAVNVAPEVGAMARPRTRIKPSEPVGAPTTCLSKRSVEFAVPIVDCSSSSGSWSRTIATISKAR